MNIILKVQKKVSQILNFVCILILFYYFNGILFNIEQASLEAVATVFMKKATGNVTEIIITENVFGIVQICV